MNKLISAMLLIASCAFAQSNANSSDSDVRYHAHRGFYFSVGTGFAYTSLSKTINSKSDYDPVEETDRFSSLLSYDEFRLGASIANVASIYATFGFGFGYGSYEDEIKRTGDDPKEGSFEEDGNPDIRLLFGVGGEFYPIQNKESSIYGLFFGISAGLTLDFVTYTDHYYDDVYDETISTAFANLYCRFEIGKEFWISRRWSFGVALSYTIGGQEEESGPNYIDEQERESHTGHTFGLMIRLTH